MIKRTIRLIISILIIITITINKAYAYSFGIPYVSTGNEGSSSSTPVKEYNDGGRTAFRTTDEYIYSCKFQYKVNVSRNITMNIYDSQGKLINEASLLPTDGTKFPAGTGIGLDTYEKSKVLWEIKNVQVTRSGYKCKQALQEQYGYWSSYSCTGSGYATGYYDVSNSTTKIVNNSSLCRQGSSGRFNYSCWSVSSYSWYKSRSYSNKYRYYYETISNEPTSYYMGECEKIAYDTVQREIESRKYPSYVVEYYDSNDINAAKNNGTTIKVTGEIDKCNNITVTRLSSGGYLDLCTFDYNLEKTCIDTLTGKVSYNRNCTEGKELEVQPPGGAKTMYFSPLNAKTNEEFKLLLNTWQSAQIMTKAQCDYIKKTYSNSWQNLIVGPNNEMLTPENYNSKVRNVSGKTACRIKTSIVFPIVQQFYGQTSDYKALKGYGMYFRQIDINNPFPNGLSSTSYWYGNYKDKKVNGVKLSTFNNITYAADLTGNSKTEQVRSFNGTYTYSMWESTNNVSGMNANGTSNFIRNGPTSSVFTKKADTKSFYKLGCGPLNATWRGCRK